MGDCLLNLPRMYWIGEGVGDDDDVGVGDDVEVDDGVGGSPKTPT